MNRLILAAAALAVAGCATTTVPVSTQSPAPAPSLDSADPFLWLEDVTAERSLTWVREQNDRSLARLTKNATFNELYDDALAILGSDARIPYGNIQAGFVYNFWQDTEHVRGLWRRAPLTSFVDGAPQWEAVLDIDLLAKTENRNWVFGGVSCLPPAYEHCMVELSDGGTDASIQREFSTLTREFVRDGFALPKAKGNVAWLDEDRLIVATDFGAGSISESGYPFEIRLWHRGQALDAAPTVFRGESSDVAAFPAALRDETAVWPMVIQALTFFEYKIHVQREDGATITLPLPNRVSVVGKVNGKIIAHLKEPWEHNGARYATDAIVALTLDEAGAVTSQLVYAPGQSEALEQIRAGKDDLFVVLLDDVIGKVKRLRETANGWTTTALDLPPNGTVSISSTNGKGNDLLVSYESMTVPDSLFYVDGAGMVAQVQSLPELYDATDVVVEQRFAMSRDGTRVPYFVMGRSDVLARGNAPTIQYGYGGFAASILPTYYADPGRPQHGALAGRLWVARGGVMVLSNIRGGGEYGSTWHKSALKQNRQLAFDDFFAVGTALVATGVTTPDKLGAIGRSNGGLLMGAAMIQRPDLYAAIDCGVPLLDMLRYHKLLAGASWMGEYGNPDVPEERDYISAYSPYQALRRDTDYPDVLFYTSTKDDRVHPGHARKMAAKMASYGYDFLYYENIEGGHGGTANQDQLAYRTALEYMFFVETLMN
ncbi:MAG: prolyl oligopeptidase family protein [Gammaproteobacteria bacterium]